MTKLQIDGFTDADDTEYDGIEFPVPWRNPETGEGGIETFFAKPRIPSGVLFDLEAGNGQAVLQLIGKSLRKDDFEVDDDENEVPGTSSSDRWHALINDEDRETPGLAISQVLSGLYKEYTNRRLPAAVRERPTQPDAQSSGASSNNGTTSPARRPRKASTSRPSTRRSA